MDLSIKNFKSENKLCTLIKLGVWKDLAIKLSSRLISFFFSLTSWNLIVELSATCGYLSFKNLSMGYNAVSELMALELRVVWEWGMNDTHFPKAASKNYLPW